MGWESYDVVRFDPEPLQHQTRMAKPKSAYNLLITDPRGLWLGPVVSHSFPGGQCHPKLLLDGATYFLFLFGLKWFTH